MLKYDLEENILRIHLMGESISMLDESLKNSKQKSVGFKQTQRALEKGTARRVFVAKDAEDKVTRPIIELCRTRQVEFTLVPTMVELGKACGIEVGAAVAAILAD